ncbi:hypothetical protein QC760_002239 [Botrytis cinerea]
MANPGIKTATSSVIGTDTVLHSTMSSTSEKKAASDIVELPGVDEAISTGGKVFTPDWRFWVILTSLGITSLLTAIEASVTSTALPSVAKALDAKELYVWFASAFFLTSTISQPLFGQFANVFGRRWPIIVAVALFALGSGICGGATSSAMLIAGRGIQGIGVGGVNVMIDCIVCDLVPLRERPNYMAFIFLIFAVGSSLGPFVGGVLVDRATWRWIFYISLPVAGTSLFLMLIFLQVEYRKQTTFEQKMKRIDWLGNFLLSGAVISILYALTYAGALSPWSSWKIIFPLVLGIVVYILFHVYEASSYCVEPTIPPRMFGNRTSAIAFIATFIHGMLTYWTLYFLPVYFQGVLQSTPTRSGVQLLPTVIVLVPFAIFAALWTTKTGRYKPPQLVGWAFMVAGLGALSTLDPNSSTAKWAIFQILIAMGSGMINTPLLPAIQAGLPESDVAASAATWSFMRAFGSIWGVSIPGAILDNQFNSIVAGLSDKSISDRLVGGSAYQQASKEFINSFSPDVRIELIDAYSRSLKIVWYVALGFGILGFIITWGEKEIALRETLETDYGMKERKAKTLNASNNA